MELAVAESAVALEAPISVSRTSTGAEWNSYVCSHPLGTVDHRWEWREIFQRVFGHDSEYLVARRGDRIVGVLPLVLFRSLIFGRLIVSLPMLNYGGLLTDDSGARQPLLAEAERIGRKFRAKYIELRHREKLTELPSREHKVSVLLDLPASEDALWQQLDRKVRNQVRKAQKSDLTVQHGGRELVGDFYRVFAENMRDLGTPVYSRRLFERVAELFPTESRVHVIRHAGQPVAGSVTLAHTGTVLVPWASSLRHYRQLCPNMLLYWSMLEHAVSSGARVFDFGRSSVDASTLAFKLQWGAESEPQAWEYRLLARTAIPEHGVSSPRFETAVRAWMRLPIALATRIGPSIVRQIP
jgi:FemAB-related protein (PEP-CTERM system-associated)